MRNEPTAPRRKKRFLRALQGWRPFGPGSPCGRGFLPRAGSRKAEISCRTALPKAGVIFHSSREPPHQIDARQAGSRRPMPPPPCRTRRNTNKPSAAKPMQNAMKIPANPTNPGVLDHHPPGRHGRVNHTVQACAARTMREIPEPSRPRKTPKAGLSR